MIELTIVIVIVGLMVGGVMVGSALIDAAERRHTIENINDYMSAVRIFQEKYNALPGDMHDATSIWGAANADETACRSVNSLNLSNPKLTCDGDGNGRIGNPFNPYVYERFRFWQHLSNAEIIKGKYSGVAGSGGPQACEIDINCPGSLVPGAGFGVVWWGLLSGYEGLYDGDYGNTITYGKQAPDGPLGDKPALTPSDTKNIDTKLDDGLPATGLLRAFKREWQDCATTNNASTAQYDTANTQKSCSFLIITGF